MAKAQAARDESLVELLIRHFSEKLTNSSSSLPSARCISRPDLIRLLGTIHGELSLPRSVSALALLTTLERSGLIKPVAISPLSERVKKDRLYAIGLDADPAALDPAELLQAHVPDGVICYFTALQIHELTTQPPPHHHIAKLRAMPQSETSVLATGSPPLGTAQFEYQGVPFYVSIRDTTILRKHQQRFLNARSRVRVTTLEQTLIDTLHRPMSAGGPSVVFEAWNTASPRVDEAAIIDLLLQIQHPLLSRRVGYMLEHVSGSRSPRSNKLHSHVREQMGQDNSEPSPLIASMPYKTQDSRWHLLVP